MSNSIHFYRVNTRQPSARSVLPERLRSSPEKRPQSQLPQTLTPFLRGGRVESSAGVLKPEQFTRTSEVSPGEGSILILLTDRSNSAIFSGFINSLPPYRFFKML